MSDAIHSGSSAVFDEAGQLVRESRLFAATRRIAGVLARALEGSRVVAATRSRAAEFAQLAVRSRLRILGVMLLCAAGTNAVLLLFVPRHMTPAPPFVMPVVAGLAAALLIVRSSR
jgi:hypothetical protein